MLFDTDVLIWNLRANKRASAAIDAADVLELSIVTFMELLHGARDRKELRVIKSFLADLGFTILPLTEDIGHRASIYIEEYGLKSNIGIADALIAATAVERQTVLCTGNIKDYRSIAELQLKPFRP
ncbi:type II toxin-antitoxin system VapC family toxin [bacterium]|nr:type II toxin-antitoxin system VapC family toxin [bacterium]